jgi:hypothetical protein
MKEIRALEQELGLGSSYNYLEFNELLVSLHFLSTETQVSSEVFIKERELASDAWLII